eukprot:g7549.t1
MVPVEPMEVAAPMMTAAPVTVTAAPITVTAAPMAYMPAANVSTGVAVPAAGTVYGGFMDQFDRMDLNHDGVLQRSEWDRGMQGAPRR